MTLHPYLASTPDLFHRLIRANFWLVADADFRNAAYWREQVALCEEAFVSQHFPPSIPDDVRERRKALVRQQVGVAMREGYGARVWHRGGTDVPVAGCF